MYLKVRQLARTSPIHREPAAAGRCLGPVAELVKTELVVDKPTPVGLLGVIAELGAEDGDVIRIEKLPKGAEAGERTPGLGWRCPKCGCVYAPTVLECPRCNAKVRPLKPKKRRWERR